MAFLALIRHGESEWNAQGLWTGRVDVSLTERGRREARSAARTLRGIVFASCHCSSLRRAKESLEEAQKVLRCAHLPMISHSALDERDYGVLTGKNKWKIREEHGEEQFLKWRRGWNEPIPGGETLKDVYARAVPYFKNTILPELKQEKNVLVCAHGNSLRALVKHFERLTAAGIREVEIPTGGVYLYTVDRRGKITSKEIRMG